MNPLPEQSFPYRYSGGSLDANDPTYIKRWADEQFYQGLRAGQFCYVFNSRQMGKSSLRIQTRYRLQCQGVACAEIDLMGIVSQETTNEQWYLDLIKELVGCFQLRMNRRSWWREHNDLTPVHRFQVFIEEVLLKQVQQAIVIFVDEIDSVLTLKFPIDDFFALIRSGYDKRASKPDYKRLTWALLGVATPSDLITDKQHTPFNIGWEIELRGFEWVEAKPLTQGFVGKVGDAQAVLKEILNWTGGQPFLTQKLCWIVANCDTVIPVGNEAQAIAQLVRSRLIENWQSQDNPEHLRTIRDRILRRPRGSRQLLKRYQQILKRGAVAAYDTPEQRELQLSGLVVRQDGKLRVYNPIYASVFDLNWVKTQLKTLPPDASILPISTVWVASFIITCLVMGLRWLGMFQAWELMAFDHLIRKLPPEPLDNRLLIIGADEQDISGKGYGYPLPDAILAQLLDKLQQYQPAAIGLDIVRDQPVPKNDWVGDQALARHLENNQHLITICAFDQTSSESILPPPKSPAEQVGFVDLYSDNDLIQGDYTIRRYLLSRSKPKPKSTDSSCTTPYSFSWQLVYLYLDSHNMPITTVENDWKFGAIIVKRLEQHSSGYHYLDAKGNQLLIHYRRTTDPTKIAPQVTVRDVLTNSHNFDPDLVKNRIVLIAMTASSDTDIHDTPLGKMPGVSIHAHVISQILSAVEENRRLLWWLPEWGDTLWVLFWSCIGGGIVGWVKIPLYRWLAISSSLIVLYGVCWIVLRNGGWIPLVPSVLGLGLSGGSVVTYIAFSFGSST